MAIDRSAKIDPAAPFSEPNQDPDGYGDSVRQIIEDNSTFQRLLDVKPGNISIDVDGEDVYVHAGADCASPKNAEKLLQSYIDRETNETPVIVHVIPHR